MVVDLKGIRVFIATPGGLDEVRKCFYDRLIRFNHDDANERGVSFMPVGWELSLAGKGRPQAQINEEVRRCDYLVLVLHDRWGSPPAENGPYSSGTEEEYNVARGCLEDADAPMRNIAVMFQGVDAARLADPGDQLKKVLAFKERLENERSLLFTTFDSAREFEDDLLAHLLRWMRDEAKTTGAHAPPPVAADDVESLAAETPSGATGDDSAESPLDQAKRLMKEGRLTRAESIYALAVAGAPDIEALTQYTRFLRRTGRLERATGMANRLLDVAREHGDHEAEVEALSNRGIIARKHGQYSASIEDFETALSVATGAEDVGEGNIAFLLDNVALTRRKEGKLGVALEALGRSLEIRRKIDDPRGLANSLNNVGALRRQRGDVEMAQEMHSEAIRLFQDIDDSRGEANARANLGEAFYAAGQLGEAKGQFAESLEINETLKSPEGIGMNNWQLGRVALDEGDLGSARTYALRCLTVDERAPDRPESIGGAFHLYGQIELADGNPSEAVVSLQNALKIYERTGQRLGAAWTAADLARAYVAAGELNDAKRALDKAVAFGSELDHVQLGATLKAAEVTVTQAVELLK